MSKDLLNGLVQVDGVISVTLVGTFVDQPGMAGISDIDTVVICRQLTHETYDSLVGVCEKLELDRYGLGNYQLHINSTFGPRKFNTDGRVVIHLMIYDIARHVDHVLKSPFTCLDWERSETCRGPSLATIASVGQLQLRDFTSSRRSVRDYLDDIASQSLTYRQYEWSATGVSEKTHRQRLDDKGRGEFAYHVVKNLMTNFLKLETGTNTLPTREDLTALLQRVGVDPDKFFLTFDQIRTVKQTGQGDFPIDSVGWAQSFLDDFSKFIEDIDKTVPRILFVRHAKTVINDEGRFLGCRQDPGILDAKDVVWDAGEASVVYSSPLTRARQTAELIAPGANVTVDENLREIDYGDADGMLFGDFFEAYPEVVSGWAAKKDPPFPGGECTSDVDQRIRVFLDTLSERLPEPPSAGSIVIVSHNVVLRCLLGRAFGLPMHLWHHLRIDHVTPYEFRWIGNRFVPNVDRNILAPPLNAMPLTGTI